MFKQEFILNSEGKDILILAGIHGNELTPIYTLLKFVKYGFINSIKNKYIRKITAINCVNEPAIISKTRGIREIDLNRLFDSEAIAKQLEIRDIITKEIDNHYAVIDLHSYGSKNINQEIVLINNNNQAQRYVEFCKLTGIHFALQNEYQHSLKQYALDQGKVAFTIELSGTNKINIRSAYQGIHIITTILENIQTFEFNQNVTLEKYSDDFCLIHLNSEYTGLFVDNMLMDLNGNILENYNIHKNIIFNTTHDFVNKGDYCISVQPNIDYQ